MYNIKNKEILIDTWENIQPFILNEPIVTLKEETLYFFKRILDWLYYHETANLELFEKNLLLILGGDYAKSIELRNSIRIYHLILLHKKNLLSLENSLSNPLIKYLNTYFE